MENFNFYSPTEFVFGKDRENEVGSYVKKYGGTKVHKKGVFQFIREVRTELKKVSWPTNKELVSYTGVVGLAVVIVCVLIWVCDTAFAKLFRIILG